MTKDISLLLGELQSEKPTSFRSVANKSALRTELERYEDLIIFGIASGHTARGFYEKLKDADEIEAISKEFNPSRPEDTFKQHFIRIFHDYRDTLVAEGKVEKPSTRKKKQTLAAAQPPKANVAPVQNRATQTYQKPIYQTPTQQPQPRQPQKFTNVPAEPVPFSELIKPQSIPTKKPAQEGNSLRRNKLSEF